MRMIDEYDHDDETPTVVRKPFNSKLKNRVFNQAPVQQQNSSSSSRPIKQQNSKIVVAHLNAPATRTQHWPKQEEREVNRGTELYAKPAGDGSG